MSVTIGNDDVARGILAATTVKGGFSIEQGNETLYNGKSVTGFADVFENEYNAAGEAQSVLSGAVNLSAIENLLKTRNLITPKTMKVGAADAYLAGAMYTHLVSAGPKACVEYPSCVRLYNYVMNSPVSSTDNTPIREVINRKNLAPAFNVIELPPAKLFSIKFDAIIAAEKKPVASPGGAAPAAAGNEKKQAEQPQAEKKQQAEKPKAEKPAAAAAAAAAGGDDEDGAVGNDIGRMKTVVAKVVEVANHPTEAKLLVLQLDIGAEKPIQIVAGIAEFVPKESLQNATIAVITNLKPGEVKGVNSVGRCIVATSADGSVKELIRPADSCPAGEVIAYRGVTQQFDAQVAPKRFHKILKSFCTNENGEVQCQGAVFETSAGVLKSSVKNGTVA